MSLSVSLSFEQKVAYAERSLGVDLQQDSRGLFDLVQSMLDKPLPEPWRPCFDEHWRLFFYNDRSRVSAWSHPMRPAHQRVVDAYRRLEVAPSSAAVEEELQGFRDAAEAELEQWRESQVQADGRTFYVHVETRQTTWDNPAELIMCHLALEVEMLNWSRLDLPRTAEDAPQEDQEVTEEQCEQSQPSISSAQSWLPSELPSPRAASVGTLEHLQDALVIRSVDQIVEAELHQIRAAPHGSIDEMVEEADAVYTRQQEALSLLISVARRWLCQQHLATARRKEAALLLQAKSRSWLCRCRLATAQQTNARNMMTCFLRRWLSWKALLELQTQHQPVEDSDNDTVYSSDYEAQEGSSSPSRSRDLSPTSRVPGVDEGDHSPTLGAKQVDGTRSEELATSDSSLSPSRHAARWEGVSSPHWQAHMDLPKLPEIPEMPEALVRDFQSQAETFVSGLGRDSKGFEHLLEVARAELPKFGQPRRQSKSIPQQVPRLRRKLRRVAEQDFLHQVHKDAPKMPQVPNIMSSHETQTEPESVQPEMSGDASAEPATTPRWERRVLDLLAEESPKREASQAAKRGNEVGPGYALKELAKNADKAKELKKTLRKDHRQVYEAYSNVFEQLKVLEQVKLPSHPNARPKVKSKAKRSAPSRARSVLTRSQL